MAAPIDRDRLAHALARDVVLGGGVTATVLFVVLGLLVPDPPGESLSAWEQSVEEVVLSALLIPLAYWYVRRRTVQALQWIDSGERPLPDDRSAVVTLPWRLALVGLRFWVALAVVAFAYNLVDDRFEHTLADEVLNASLVALVGLTSAGVTYLLSQRSLRPVYVVALAGVASTDGVRIGLRRRLVLSWTLRSGVPALMILVLIAWRGDADLDAAIAVLAGAALCAGAAFAFATARNLAEPLDRLRVAVQEITAGDLGSTVTVDDATELGHLQAGFNAMTEGLRERRRLEDLFGRHVGAEVARTAIARGAALGGERRRVSVVFVDLEGSTQLASSRDPAEVVATLNEFFGHVIAVVTEQGGWINKFHGERRALRLRRARRPTRPCGVCRARRPAAAGSAHRAATRLRHRRVDRRRGGGQRGRGGTLRVHRHRGRGERGGAAQRAGQDVAWIHGGERRRHRRAACCRRRRSGALDVRWHHDPARPRVADRRVGAQRSGATAVIGNGGGDAPSEPRNTASPKVKIPPSSPTIR